MKNPRQILLRVPESMYQAIQIRAYYEGQTMSAVIRNAIQKHVKPMTKAEVEEGRS